MAIYDIDANATTAVTAVLAQVAISATGDITPDSPTDTFHVKWLHRALQKKVWDFSVSGNDNINLAKPNPSTSEALGTIITLIDHTTEFGVRYNITDAVAEMFFGGSIVQQNGSAQQERYAGVRVSGSVNSGTTELQVVQDAGLLTSHWGTGKNQTDANTLLRILVKDIVAGAAIDNSTIVIKANEWGDNYAIWITSLGLGESSAAIIAGADPQNTRIIGDFPLTGHATAVATVEGYQQNDVDGLGADNFIGQASYAALTGNQDPSSLYQSIKYALRRGTTDTFFGLDGDLWTGRVYDIDVDTGNGSNWVQNEEVTWTGGVGRIMGFDNALASSCTRLIIHLSTGVAPTDGLTLTGGGGATNDVNTNVTSLTTNANFLGLFTGSNWIGAFGIGFNELIFGDSVTSLDGETPTVPQNVTVTINVEANNAAHDPHVFLAKKDPGGNYPDYTTHTAVGEALASGNIDVNEAVPADTPQAGWIGVLKTGAGQTAYKFYEYSAWSGTQFTLVGTVADDVITAADPIFIAYFYDSVAGGGTSKTVNNTHVYDSDFELVGWVRQGLETAPDKVIPLQFNVGSSNITQNVSLDAET